VNIVADQRKLKQIMFNLLSNAVKFNSAGGAVRVKARKDGNFIEIAVADSGMGIREEDIPKLFHPFSSWKPVTPRKTKGPAWGWH